MTIDVDAVYEDGVLKPERPLQLEEKAKVHVIIEVKAEEAPAAAGDDPTGWKAIDRLMGIGSGGRGRAALRGRPSPLDERG
jgi:hypothetical protein